MEKADIGLVGLAVMGENLILNMESRGYTVAVFNRTVDKVDEFMAGRAKGKKIVGAHTLQELVAALKAPRKVMLMVKAGAAVDEFIDHLTPLLSKGDIIIDGGNSHFPDTIRRTKALEAKGLLYIGTGVSGGEEGALKGPSIMPGGSRAAWPAVKPIFQAIAAKVEDGTPCCDWVGDDGAGHFVKMVHNGIEYGDMQLICESYQMMKDLLGLSADEMHQVFAEWNRGDLDSYLIEITRDILGTKDKDGAPLVARILSAMKDERVNAAKILRGPTPKFSGGPGDKKAFIADLGKALYASKIVSYAQGYQMMQAAAQEFKWDLSYGGIALLWRGGCIIRSKFLGKIKEAYDHDPKLSNLLLAPFFQQKIDEAQAGWRNVVATAVANGIWIPAHSTALTYFDGFRTARLPANLLQAQRDYFGAHQYERVDQPRGQFFHTNWTGRGGDTASSAYIV